MKRSLWVVEWYENGDWVSSVWAGLTRKNAQEQQKQLRFASANKNMFRVRKYVAWDADK